MREKDEDPETDETNEAKANVSSRDTRGKREMTDLEKLIWGIEDE